MVTRMEVKRWAMKGYLTDEEMNQALDAGVCKMTRQARCQAHIVNSAGFQYDWESQRWDILSWHRAGIHSQETGQ